MASAPDGRVASAAFAAPAGFTSLPVPSDRSRADLSADELLQRQLDALAAIHRRLQELDGALQPALVPAFSHPLMLGDGLYLWLPELRRFQRALASLEAECGALVRATQTRLDRTRRGVRRVRDLNERWGTDHEGR
ncbi:MAG: hypothetical protein EA420_10800 [Candidatus Competibacteraceae bacterium]|nr:MAG: hypothetical protein EA420_10800 [Candidatus Competibacteraceae bacterium]